MRKRTLAIAVFTLSGLAGCAAEPVNVAGDAGPAGAPSMSVTASTTPTTSPTVATPSAVTSTEPVAEPTRSVSPTPTSGRTSAIRRTDWPNTTLTGLTFMDFGTARFRDGTASSSGPVECTMLPGGARPAYAEYLAEEPANSPTTEDALILVECGSDGMDQALVPVQLSYDQKSRHTVGFIPADTPTGPNNRMTFTSYTVESGTIVTTVRKTDGSKEMRRYRFDGGTSWERA
ncbi:hypothetical protein ACWKSP_23075 [Micromonosporaceae bacterium Da 78-11]